MLNQSISTRSIQPSSHSPAQVTISNRPPRGRERAILSPNNPARALGSSRRGNRQSSIPQLAKELAGSAVLDKEIAISSPSNAPLGGRRAISGHPEGALCGGRETLAVVLGFEDKVSTLSGGDVPLGVFSGSFGDFWGAVNKALKKKKKKKKISKKKKKKKKKQRNFQKKKREKKHNKPLTKRSGEEKPHQLEQETQPKTWPTQDHEEPK